MDDLDVENLFDSVKDQFIADSVSMVTINYDDSLSPENKVSINVSGNFSGRPKGDMDIDFERTVIRGCHSALSMIEEKMGEFQKGKVMFAFNKEGVMTRKYLDISQFMSVPNDPIDSELEDWILNNLNESLMTDESLTESNTQEPS